MAMLGRVDLVGAQAGKQVGKFHELGQMSAAVTSAVQWSL
jgi:hypothetical protein